MNRILIVEDEITISRLIAVSLRRAGYDCTVANDGSTAADLIAEHDFDLALLDIMLPGLDGYELLGYLRPLGVPVIFITAKGATKDRVRGLQLGADDYIVKPFEIEDTPSRMITRNSLHSWVSWKRMLTLAPVTWMKWEIPRPWERCCPGRSLPQWFMPTPYWGQDAIVTPVSLTSWAR